MASNRNKVVNPEKALSSSAAVPWTNRESAQLVSKLHALQPQPDTRGFDEALRDVDWDELQIGDRRPDEIRQMASRMLAKVRSHRTLAEMLKDAPSVLVLMPKFPVLAVQLFLKSKQGEPEDKAGKAKANHYKAFKCGRQWFHEKSAKDKEKYENQAMKARIDFLRQLSEFVAANPDTKGTETPPDLFWQSCCDCVGGPIPKNQARVEWNLLTPQERFFFVRVCFRLEPSGKLLTVKEHQQMLDEFLGKPEPFASSMRDYYEGHIATYIRDSGLYWKDRKNLARNVLRMLTDLQRKVLEQDMEQLKQAYNEQMAQYQRNKQLEVKGLFKREFEPDSENVSDESDEDSPKKKTQAPRNTNNEPHCNRKSAQPGSQQVCKKLKFDYSTDEDESDQDEEERKCRRKPRKPSKTQSVDKLQREYPFKDPVKAKKKPFDPVFSNMEKNHKQERITEKLGEFVKQWQPRHGRFLQDLEEQTMLERVRKRRRRFSDDSDSSGGSSTSFEFEWWQEDVTHRYV